MIWPPPGDHDPAIVHRAQKALTAAAAEIIAQLTKK
jgi:hypothetical protein